MQPLASVWQAVLAMVAWAQGQHYCVVEQLEADQKHYELQLLSGSAAPQGPAVQLEVVRQVSCIPVRLPVLDRALPV